MNLKENWQEEKRSAYLYEIMAQHEKNLLHQKLFNELKAAAENQASLWQKRMLENNQSPLKAYLPDWRTRLIAWLIKKIGTENLHSILSAMKIRGMSVFKQHHNEHSHTSLNAASNLRAAVFGINDGLVSNMSLILGITSANLSHHTILLTGIAGLLAGACSMGAGEYISVRSQREVFEYQIAIEKEELEEYPEEEKEELSLIYQARGMPKEDADHLASLMISHPKIGLQTLAREELGLNPESLVSPISAMCFSFIAFAMGAGLPLLPFLFHPSQALFYSIGLTGLALFSSGALLSLFTNRNPIWSGLRMLGVGFIAGLITFTIGKWFGVG